MYSPRLHALAYMALNCRLALAPRHVLPKIVFANQLVHKYICPSFNIRVCMLSKSVRWQSGVSAIQTHLWCPAKRHPSSIRFKSARNRVCEFAGRLRSQTCMFTFPVEKKSTCPKHVLPVFLKRKSRRDNGPTAQRRVGSSTSRFLSTIHRFL